MNSVVFNGTPVTPSKVVCIGRNYAEHITELRNAVPDEPMLFIKPNSAIGEVLRAPGVPCRYEGEISFLIRSGKIAGVSFGLDLTLSEKQNELKAKGLPWEKSKAYDGSALFGEFVPCHSWQGLRLELWINGKARQNGGVELMIYPPPELFAEIQKSFTLADNDIVMTGTPKGVGELLKGDRYVGKIFNGAQLLVEKSWTVE